MVALTYSTIIWASILVLLPHGVNTRGTMCYECQYLSHPRDCNNVVHCGAHQACFVERFVTTDATVYYNSGCKGNLTCHGFHPPIVGRRETHVAIQGDTRHHDTNIYPRQVARQVDTRRQTTRIYPDCSICCTGDYCNTNLCEAHPVNSTLHRCMSCDSVERLTDCHTVKGCGQDELCYTTFFVNTFGENRYRLGCTKISDCQFGGRKPAGEIQFCSKCCQSGNCNRELCKDAPTALPLTTVGHTMTSRAVCEDDPNRRCDPLLLKSICIDAVNQTFCRRSCGQCGGSGLAPVPIAPVTSFPSTPDVCEDSTIQSCEHDILPIVCFDDIMKYFCKKSCRLCGVTIPPPVNCVDTHPVQCADPSTCQHICADNELANVMCPKSCGICQRSTIPPPVNCVDIHPVQCADPSTRQHICADNELAHLMCPKSCGICQSTPCVDVDTRCFNIVFLARACSDPVLSRLCRQSCRICP